jgi:hypothetical protein
MKNLLCAIVCLLITASLHAQTTNGSIQGSVFDPSGASVAGATVTVQDLATGLAVSTKTTDAGLYSVPNLPPGTYKVTAEAQGMKKYEQTGVTVQIASTTSLDITMQLGEVSQTITVSANASQLEATTSDVGATVSQQFVAELPLEVSGTPRNPVQFITLVPGFVGNVGNNPGDNTSDDFKVDGGQEGGTDVLVDGVSISLVSPNTQWNKGVSPEGVQEFKVLQNNFSAEYGESGDGIVTLNLKSGTNQFHGSAYDFLRNRVLDSNSWQNNTAGLPKSVDTQNDFGFSVGGPVYLPKLYDGRNRSFFFFDYEGFRFRTGGTGIDSFPNEAFRAGNFSALLPSDQLYDPTTHQPIPGNLLSNDPNFTLSSVISKVFSFLPATNGALTNNVINTTVSPTTADIWDLKFDQTISDKQRISFGFDYDNTDTGSTSSLGPIFGQSVPQNTRYTRFSHEYIFSPTVFNHFLIGFSRRFRGEISNSLGGGYPAKLGISGVQNTTFPCILWLDSPYDSVLNNCGDSEFADNVYQVDDAVSWVKGKHDFKFGGEVRALQFNVRRLTESAGEFCFDPSVTSSTGVSTGVGGEAVASSEFGLVQDATVNFGSFSGVRYKDFALYAQDSYKATNRLTLNYGLRYDIDLPAAEAFDRFSEVDPTLPNPGAGGILGAYTYFGTGPGRNGQTRPQNTYGRAFGPRVGFAYSINNKTVVRSGYGIFYEDLKEPSFADQDGLGFFNKETLTTANVAPFQIDNGVPQILPPTGVLTPQGQNGNSGVILIPPNSGILPDIQSWNLDVQRQIAANLLVDAAYVGSKGTHLPTLNIIPNQVNPVYLSLGNDLGMDISCLSNGSCPNAIAAGVKVPYAGFSGTVAQALRPFPQYGNFTQDDNSFGPDKTGNSTYNAFQLKVDRRFAEGLNFLVSYTVSKNITDADSEGAGVSGFTGNGAYIGQNSYDRRAEKAVSQLDTPQSLVASFFYELPVGRGKRWASSAGALDRAVSGWYVSSILTYQSGQPTSVYQSCTGTAGDVLFGGCNVEGADARVNVNPGVPQTNKSGNFQPATTSFYNAAAFSLVTPNPVTGVTTFGDEPRALDHARAFGPRNEDFTIGKKTRLLGEKANLDFRAEFFNIFNRHIYSPYQNQTAGVFATPLNTPFVPVGGPGCPGPFACGFGAVTNASGPRIIQFGLRISY